MADWTPTPAEVHALIPTRNNGAAFSETSTPTEDEVETLADGITTEILATVGVDLPDVEEAGAQTLHDLAKFAAQLGTAALIELGEFPEQGGFGDQTNVAGAALYARYRQTLEMLARKVRGFGVSGVRSLALEVFDDDCIDVIVN